MKMATIILSCGVAIASTGCATNEQSGTLLGAAAGGLIGNQFGKGGGRVAATVAGVVIGGMIGNKIGRDLDEQDRRRAYEAEMAALDDERDGDPHRWRNPDRDRYGYVTPRRVYYYESRRCREFETTIFIDGHRETVIGKACRNPDGTWSEV